MQVQVVEKRAGNNRVVKHFGTARNDIEQQTLTQQAQTYLDEKRISEGRISLFDNRYTQADLAKVMSFVKVRRTLSTPTYRVLAYFYHHLGFDVFNDTCFRDLVIARLVKPGSKATTKEWLERKLDKRYSLTGIYRHMRFIFDQGYQSKLEQLMVSFLKEHHQADLAVIFFDVTTLYYEAFDEDDLRKCGFSKEHKHNQPQLVVALTVSQEGFPIQLNIFPGNKFEGHTFIPCLTQLINRHQLQQVVVVADSAMISRTNMAALEAEGIQYIVGARLGNLNHHLFEQITSMPKLETAPTHVSLESNRRLVVSYSLKRANKDRADRNKQLKRAAYALRNPATIANRFKYLQKAAPSKVGSGWELNQEKITKAIKLEGLKGYLTNADNLTDQEVIEKYSSLWQVERSFRISKSDLKARPIFHTTREKIEAHLTIVFAALAVAQLAEYTGRQSIRKVIKELEYLEEVILIDTVGRVTFSLFSKSTDPLICHLLKLAKCEQAIG